MIFGKKKDFYPWQTKNILITGGAGFLGSHLCDRLLKRGNVICVDNLSGNQAINNIKHLLQKPNFRFIKHDINQNLDFEQSPELKDFRIKLHGIQEIYHLACPTSAKNFDKQKINTLYTNSTGILNVLEMTRKYKAKFLFTSSSVVYGPKRQDNSPFRENEFGAVNSISPRACYDEGKRFSETAVVTYKEVYGINAKIARIFRTYGPRQALFDGQMIPDFVLQALNNKPLIIYGDKDFSTSLCFVDDLVEGIIKLMDSKELGPINIGHPQEYKLMEKKKKIVQMTGSESQIEFRAPLPFTTPLGLPDITLAREKLGWFPVTRIEDGFKILIDYVKANRILLEPLITKYEQQ